MVRFAFRSGRPCHNFFNIPPPAQDPHPNQFQSLRGNIKHFERKHTAHCMDPPPKPPPSLFLWALSISREVSNSPAGPAHALSQSSRMPHANPYAAELPRAPQASAVGTVMGTANRQGLADPEGAVGCVCCMGAGPLAPAPGFVTPSSLHTPAGLCQGSVWGRGAFPPPPSPTGSGVKGLARTIRGLPERSDRETTGAAILVGGKALDAEGIQRAPGTPSDPRPPVPVRQIRSGPRTRSPGIDPGLCCCRCPPNVPWPRQTLKKGF